MQKIYIIEDEPLIKELLFEIIDSSPTLELAGTADDGEKGLQECIELAPDMVILDMNLPSLPGLEIAQKLKEHLSAINILFFSGVFSESHLKNILHIEGTGIIEKTAGLDEIKKRLIP